MKESPFIAVLKRELDRMVSGAFILHRVSSCLCFLSSLWLQFLVTDRWRICLWVLWMVIIQPLLVR